MSLFCHLLLKDCWVSLEGVLGHDCTLRLDWLDASLAADMMLLSNPSPDAASIVRFHHRAVHRHICRPIQHLALVQKKRVAVFLILAWLITIPGGCIHFFTLLYLSEHYDAHILLLFRVEAISWCQLLQRDIFIIEHLTRECGHYNAVHQYGNDFMIKTIS